jgi:hypothetical protein
LTREASFAEEITLAQNRDDRLLALFGSHSEFDFAFPEIEQGVRRFSLREDVAVRTILNSGSRVRDSSEKGPQSIVCCLVGFLACSILIAIVHTPFDGHPVPTFCLTVIEPNSPQSKRESS